MFMYLGVVVCVCLCVFVCVCMGVCACVFVTDAYKRDLDARKEAF